jgi:hypothetical protein
VQRPQIELGGRLDATIFVVDRCTAPAILPRRESRSSPPFEYGRNFAGIKRAS